MRMVLADFRWAVAVAAIFGSLPAAFPQGATYEVVEFSGQPGPRGGTFAWFDPPRIGADGTIGFVSWLSDESAGLFKRTAGETIVVAASGDLVPGGGARFSSFGPISISKDGLFAYEAWTYDEESGAQGLWVEGGAAGMEMPVLDYGGPAFRSGTRLAVKALVEMDLFESDDYYRDVLLWGPPGSLDVRLQQGDPAPGFPAGAVIDRIFGYEGSPGPGLDMNESGDVAMKVIVAATPSGTPEQKGAIYAGAPGALGLVAAEGGNAPGGLGVFEHLGYEPSIASNGLIAFSAQVANGESEWGEAVFAGRVGSLAPLVRSGDPVPTAPEGVRFRGFGRTVVNETGDVIFGATIEYPNQTMRDGIWIKRETGPPVLLAVSGMTLDSPTGPSELYHVDFAGAGTLNDLHQFVFLASTVDGGAGIYLADTRPGIPWLRLTDPRTRRQQVTRNRVVRISGRAIDATGIEKVEYSVTPERNARGVKIKRAKRRARGPRMAKGDRNWSFRVPLAMGRNRISVVATDKLGNVSEPITFTMIRWEPGVGSAKAKRR